MKAWVGRAEAPGENLLRRCSVSELVSAREIFALASHAPLDLQRAKKLLTQSKLPENAHAKIELAVDQWPNTAAAATLFRVPVRVTNRSAYMLSSMPPYPVNVSYHWFLAGEEKVIIFDGLRTMLSYPLQSGGAYYMLALVQAPSRPGKYKLVITLVQEGCCWFDALSSCAAASAEITVV